MRNLFLALCVCCISYTAFSQEKPSIDVNSILSTRGEIYFSFKSSPSEIQSFVDMLSVDFYDGKEVKAYANQQQFTRFLQTEKEFNIVEDYYSAKSLTMATNISEMADWDRYPTYEVYVEMMQAFAQNYPDICILDTIGYSLEGRLLLVVKISDNVEVEEAEPEFLYTGMMHGDELVAGMMFLRLIDYMLSNYGTDSQITDLIDNVQIYINPFSNPDGTYAGGNSTVADATRTNGENIDMNRNYPDFIAGQNPDGNNTAIETQLMIDFAASRNFVMSVNSHSGAELLNYPYDTESILPADDDWWVLVCNDYADLAHDNSPSGYLTDEGGGVTNGYAWYTATGTRQDYMNYYELCKEVTLELSASKLLDSEDLPDHWNYNRDAMLSYLEHVTFGLTGIVTDSITHEPLEAKVFIEDYDFLNSHVYSFPLYGDYYRLLIAGDYSVTYSCEGYRSKVIDVSVTNYQKTINDVQLVKLEDLPPYADFDYSARDLSCNATILFENTSEASETTTFFWDFGDGNTSADENPEHTYLSNGNYTIKLFAENENGEDSLVISDLIEIELAQLSDIQDYVICETEGSVTIDISGNGDILWYYDFNDEIEFQTGETYTTPTLTETTTYYVEDFIQGNQYTGGEPNNSEGGSFITVDSYLLFDVHQDCILEYVTVYADGDGTRTISIRDNEGNTIYSEEVFIADGMQVLELNIDLPIGNDFKISAGSGSNLFRGSTGFMNTFDYPFLVGELVTIKENSVVWWNDENRYYSYFFNWVVKEADCVSERTPVNVFVGEVIDAQFTYSVDLNTVTFENNSVGSDTYLWDFGDESSSTEINPIHTYVSEGTYTVSLSSSSDCGSDIYEQEISVTTGINEEQQDYLKIFPNPINNLMTVTSVEKIEKLEIVDLRGRTIMLISNIETNTCQLDVSEIKSGMYLIKVYSENDIYVAKIIKN